MKMIPLTVKQARLALSALEALAEGLPSPDDVPDAGRDLQATSDLIEYLQAETADAREPA